MNGWVILAAAVGFSLGVFTALSLFAAPAARDREDIDLEWKAIRDEWAQIAADREEMQRVGRAMIAEAAKTDDAVVGGSE